MKTTTKQLMVKDDAGVTENIEEKIEDLRSGEISMSTHVNKVQPGLFITTMVIYSLQAGRALLLFAHQK